MAARARPAQVSKQPIALGAVQETMLITLYARALAARRHPELLSDRRAIDMVEAIDYNFRKFADEPQLIGSVLRTRILDELVRGLLGSAPRLTVVEVGAGLNTRFERVDNGTVQWLDVDLADAIEVRRRFFADGARRTMVASSVLERTWTDVAKARGGPWVVIAEGLFGYLPEAQVKDALALIADQLPGAVIMFDCAATGGRDERSRRAWPGLRARIVWACENGADIERWGLGYRLVDSQALADPPPAVGRSLPFSFRHALATARVLGWEIDGYRVNVYRHGGSEPAWT